LFDARPVHVFEVPAADALDDLVGGGVAVNGMTIMGPPKGRFVETEYPPLRTLEPTLTGGSSGYQ
jgi:hypothetical protein